MAMARLVLPPVEWRSSAFREAQTRYAPSPRGLKVTATLVTVLAAGGAAIVLLPRLADGVAGHDGAGARQAPSAVVPRAVSPGPSVTGPAPGPAPRPAPLATLPPAVFVLRDPAATGPAAAAPATSAPIRPAARVRAAAAALREPGPGRSMTAPPPGFAESFAPAALDAAPPEPALAAPSPDREIAPTRAALWAPADSGAAPDDSATMAAALSEDLPALPEATPGEPGAPSPEPAAISVDAGTGPPAETTGPPAETTGAAGPALPPPAPAPAAGSAPNPAPPPATPPALASPLAAPVAPVEPLRPGPPPTPAPAPAPLPLQAAAAPPAVAAPPPEVAPAAVRLAPAANAYVRDFPSVVVGGRILGAVTVHDFGDGFAMVHLGALLWLFKLRMPETEFARLAAAPAASTFVGLDELRAAGLAASYDRRKGQLVIGLDPLPPAPPPR